MGTWLTLMKGLMESMEQGGAMLDTAEIKRGAIVGHLSNYFRVAKISGYCFYQ